MRVCRAAVFLWIRARGFIREWMLFSSFFPVTPVRVSTKSTGEKRISKSGAFSYPWWKRIRYWRVLKIKMVLLWSNRNSDKYEFSSINLKDLEKRNESPGVDIELPPNCCNKRIVCGLPRGEIRSIWLFTHNGMVTSWINKHSHADSGAW